MVLTAAELAERARRQFNKDDSADECAPVELQKSPQKEGISSPISNLDDAQKIDLVEIEKLWDIQDKFRLMSWGLRSKQCYQFRQQFLTSTEHLKDKFRILLSRFLTKKSEKQFSEMMALIENYDINEDKTSTGKRK